VAAPPGDERPYSLDDLVSHEKRQMRFILLIMLCAMLYFAGKRLFGPAEDAGVAPVVSDRR
jgi:hypothetical protein